MPPITLHDLPPPVIFTHGETLHSISLPPLAEFLTSIDTVDRILKLNDILDRFRTPKSYHRVDVRFVESSELPPKSPVATSRTLEGADGEVNGHSTLEDTKGEAEGRSEEARGSGESHHGQEEQEEARMTREKRERGDPIILPKGMTKEEYLLGPTGEDDQVPTLTNGGATQGQIREDGNTLEINGEPLETLPTPASLSHQDSAPSASNGNAGSDSAQIKAPVEALHPLPPTGPKRRVRELRLDLRTLDAAALFALETWRRELLGLEKLNLDHPDSVWYEEPPPTPEPTPLPVTSSTVNPQGESAPPPIKRKRGRPRKIRPEEEQPVTVLEVADAPTPAGDTIHDEAVDGDVTMDMGLDTTMDTLDEMMSVLPGDPDPRRDEDTAGLSEVEEVEPAPQTRIIEAWEALAEPDQIGFIPDTVQGFDQPEQDQPLEEPSAEAATAVESEGEPELEPEDGLDPGIRSESAYSPSPELILEDGFDQRSEQDLDFVPPKPARPSGARRRKSSANTSANTSAIPNEAESRNPIQATSLIDLSSPGITKFGEASTSSNIDGPSVPRKRIRLSTGSHSLSPDKAFDLTIPDFDYDEGEYAVQEAVPERSLDVVRGLTRTQSPGPRVRFSLEAPSLSVSDAGSSAKKVKRRRWRFEGVEVPVKTRLGRKYQLTIDRIRGEELVHGAKPPGPNREVDVRQGSHRYSPDIIEVSDDEEPVRVVDASVQPVVVPAKRKQPDVVNARDEDDGNGDDEWSFLRD